MSVFTRRFALWLGLFSFVSAAVAAENRYVEGQLIVRFSADTTLQAARKAINAKNYEVERVLVPELNLFLVKLKNGMTVKRAMAMLNQLDDVAYAQPDHVVSLRETVPNDADFGKQWSMRNTARSGADIGATAAWDIGQGGKDRDGNDIVIAIVDGGMDMKHKDLVDNLWVNSGEIPENKIDDDGNGYVDDVNGWNAYGKNGAIPVNDHGTHVAGIAGASGNNGTHVAGVNWKVKLMPVAASSGQTSVVAEGYGYVLKQKKLWLESKGKKGANIVVTNSSFGVDYADCNSDEYRVWNDLYNEMGKVGILSAAATANQNVDVDAKGDVPTGCSSEFLIKVTNTTKDDEKNKRAGYGLKSIDLGAPGTDIYSTVPNDEIGKMSGTSMATPHVAGAVAFLHSVASADLFRDVTSDPAQGARDVKKLLLDAVDPIESLKGKTVTGGRLNLGDATKKATAFRLH